MPLEARWWHVASAAGVSVTRRPCQNAMSTQATDQREAALRFEVCDCDGGSLADGGSSGNHLPFRNEQKPKLPPHS